MSEPGTASSRADSHGRYDEYSEMGESDILGEYFQFDLIPEFRLKLQGAVRALRGSLNW